VAGSWRALPGSQTCSLGVARQPDLFPAGQTKVPRKGTLSRAGKGAQKGNEPGARRVRGRASGDGVVGDAKSALVVRLVQAHVHPSAVLLVPCLVGIPGALLQEGVGDSMVNYVGVRGVRVKCKSARMEERILAQWWKAPSWRPAVFKKRSYVDVKIREIGPQTALAARLAKQRRQLSPQMMGRTPPPSLAGFSSASKRPPAYSCTWEG
jgi:hypothetical protein